MAHISLKKHLELQNHKMGDDLCKSQNSWVVPNGRQREWMLHKKEISTGMTFWNAFSNLKQKTQTNSNWKHQAIQDFSGYFMWIFHQVIQWFLYIFKCFFLAKKQIQLQIHHALFPELSGRYYLQMEIS